MKKTIVAAAVILIIASGGASADSLSVRFNRAELASDAGRSRIHAAIAAKVESICAVRAEAQFLTLRKQRACRADLMSAALEQIGDDRLSALN